MLNQDRDAITLPHTMTDPPEQHAEYEALLGEIEERARRSDLKVERRNTEDRAGLALWLGSAEDVPLRIWNRDRASALLAIPFEEYRLVDGYEAIFSLARDEIEVKFRGAGPLGWLNRERPPLDQSYTMTASGGSNQREIEIATTSEEYRTIRPTRLPGRTLENAPVLKFRGFGARDAKKARRILDDLGPTVIFELDIVYDVPLELAKSQRVRRRPLHERPKPRSAPEFPANAYDQEPVALYMYGRSARGMPLLEYLAYYQSIEFYFPRYAAAEVRRRVEKLVKDPRFNPHVDRDIGRLVEVVQGRGGRTHGSELEQLKATLHSCLESEEIRDIVNASKERGNFFRDRRSRLTQQTLVLADTSTDLRTAAAARIYDLRCRIVHTKDEQGDSAAERLLPNSPEAQLLHHDLAMLRQIAARVIVASSRELV